MAGLPFAAVAVSRRLSVSRSSASASASASFRCVWILRQQQQQQRQCISRFLSSTTTSSASTPANKKLSKDEMNRIAIIRLYRILQRTCTNFTNDVVDDDDEILLQPQLNVRGWGYHSIFSPNRPTMTEELYRLFYIWNTDDDDDDDDDYDVFSSDTTAKSSTIDDWYYEVVEKACTEDGLPPLQSTKTCWTTKSQLQEAISKIFRVQFSDNIEKSKLLKWSIKAMQILQQQQSIWSTSSVTTTEQIRVTCTSRFVGPASRSVAMPPSALPGTSMLDTKNTFAYRIRVENLSDQRVQLLGRYWHIQETDDDDEVDGCGGGGSFSRPPIVVDQPTTGAVGQLPVLRPGQVFEYMSGVELATSTGIMKGHFYMAKVSENAPSAKCGDDVEAIRLKKEPIEVAVGPFPLRVPT